MVRLLLELPTMSRDHYAAMWLPGLDSVWSKLTMRAGFILGIRSGSKHPVPIYTEPSSTGKTRAVRLELLQDVQNTIPKRQQTVQTASTSEGKDTQDRSVFSHPPIDDISTNSSVTDYEEKDDIDPDDSISATPKQPPKHHTNRSASHQKSVPRQSQQPQPVRSPDYMESGSGVSPYPYTGFHGPGQQGIAGWVPPPAPQYPNAGYMSPNQDRFVGFNWQHPFYEEGNEMMPYQMWNPFTPLAVHGAGPPAAAPFGGKSSQSRKQHRKGKGKYVSVHLVDAEPLPDGPVVDQGIPAKDPGKSGDGAVLRLSADVDAVYNSADARDLTVHLEVDLFRDIDDEVEEFNRLARMGNFAEAGSFFESHLKEHTIGDSSMFVQYAEMLLAKGDFKSLLLLDGDAVFGRLVLPARKDPETLESKEPLEMNWMLVRAMALFHSQHERHEVWRGIEKPLHALSKTSDLGSTEASSK